MSFPIADILSKRAELGGELLAMRDLCTGQRVSYNELQRRAACSASLLVEAGISAGDRVALLCRNRIEFFELLFACAKLGAILVPLNWRMPAVELGPLMQDCAARLLVHGREDSVTAEELAIEGLGLLALDAADEQGYCARRDQQSPHPGRHFWPAGETWYLLYTSGTTGMPKAVVQTYGMALANYVNISQGMGLRASDVTLCYLPLFHTGGINLVTLPALIDGATVLILPGFDVEAVVKLIGDGQLDSFFGVPAIYQAISLHPDFETLNCSPVRTWGCGGAPMPEDLIGQFAQRGARVLNGMGMTETGPTVFLMDLEGTERKVGSVGKPQLLSLVRLVNAEGEDVAAGDTGELWFSGPGVTPGYWNRPQETKAALVEGGWLRSGDLGRCDQDGYYYVVGRLKDMYISGGENVYPAEVENQLAKHPDILEAAVVGLADDRWGEVGCAFLLVRPRHQIPSERELTLYCRDRMAPYKVPKQFLAVDEFPRTAAGKVQKHLLPLPGNK